MNTSPCSFSASTVGDNGNAYQVVNNRDNTRNDIFTYDSLNRIASAQSNGTQWGETFTIDAWGNLTNETGIAGKTYHESLNTTGVTNNRLTSFGYDAAGNMISNGSTSYVYDAENRLIATSGYSYIYDGDGTRVEKCTEGTTPGTCASGATGTLYWRGNFASDALSETDLAGNVQNTYVFFNGQRVARLDSAGAVHYYFSDHLGSHGVVENATASACEQDIDYYPYGGVEEDYCANLAQHYKFNGKERDTESGLDNFGARYDTSNLGRFMTADWAAKPTDVPYANFGNPQSLNLYSYVENNPTTVGDPDGHCPWNTPGCTPKSNPDTDTPANASAQQKTAQNQGQPAPTNPDGSPKSPNGDVPKPPPGKPPGWKPGDPLAPNEWVPKDPGKGDREKWGPKYPIPGGSQPGVSWDPEGHWDHDDGNRNRTRWLPGGGGQVDHDNNPTIMDRMRSITPGPILKWGTAGVVIYIIIDEGSRLYPPRNLVPVP